MNETDELQNVDTIVGYTSSNYFDIDLSPQFFEDPSVLVSRGISTNQTSAAAPTPSNYGFLVEADGVEFSSVTAIKPDTSEVSVPADGFGEFDLEGDFVSEAARDEAYPEGNYSVRVVENGQEIVLGPFPQTGGTLPDIPYITNWDAAQSIDPNQDFVLDWNAFSNAGPNAMIEVEIWNINDQNNETDFILAGAETGALLSADFLQPNSTYQGEIIFINPTVAPSTSNGIMIDSFYESFTQFSFQTGDEEGGGGDGPGMLFYKRQFVDQFSEDTFGQSNYSALTFLNGNSSTVTMASIDGPNTDTDLFNFTENQFVSTQPFESKAALDANYPSGDYTFVLQENGSTTNYGPFALPGDAYPAMPIIQNFNDLINFDATNPQTVSWSTVPGGVTAMNVEVRDGSNNIIWRENYDDSFPSSTQIPDNTLQSGQTYFLNIVYWSKLAGSEVPAIGLGYVTRTSMTIETSADGGGGGGGDPTGVDFIYTIKERAYDQIGNIVGAEPAEWNFGAGVEGGDLITAATITYPGSGGPVNLDRGNGDFNLDDQDFLTQEALDAAVPNGQISLNVTVDGNNQNLGPFTITGDEYPPVPNITNAAALPLSDFSQDFTIMWNSFITSDPNDQIRIELERTDDGERLIEAFYPASTTSLVIPGGTLEMNRNYELLIIFVNETDGLETPETIIGYISNTRFNFSTYPDFNASNDLEIWLSKGTFDMQNSDQDPGVQGWFFFADSGVTGITAMSINLPNGTNLDIPMSTVESDLFEYEEHFASQAELDAAFPDGIYQVTVTANGVQTTYGPYSLAGGGPPNQPYFTNYSAFQSVDPSSPFSIEWAAFSNPPQDASLELEIQSAPGYGDLDLDFDSSDPSLTSVEIPANSLEPNSKYIISGFFLAPSTTGTDPEVFLGYETLVQTTFWTGSPTVGPNPATDLTAIIGNQTNVHLNWTDNSTDETGFRVERKFIWDEDWSPLGNAAADATTFTDTTAALGEAYSYRVIAFDATDDGARSNEVEVQMQPPAEPTDLSVDPYNSSTLTLSWSDNSEGESGFGIDRSTDGTNWSNVGNTGPDENVFIDTGLDSGSTFTYRVTALSALGSSDTSDSGSDTTYEATTGKPINISTRGTIGSGDDFIMIAGFVITGNENKDIYIRGIAPSLPITGETALLQDPELILFDGAKNQIDFNDNWKDHPRMADTIATFIPPPLDQESAIYTNLAPGVYTVQMRGADGGIGAGLVEVYEANPGDDAQLVNISTRGIAGTGDGLMIAGVIVKGTGNRTLYVRGNGPSLPSSLEGRLTDTTLVMRDASENIVAESDNWMDNDNFASIVATTIPPGFPEEAAILVNVPASASGEKYTIELRGAGGEEGLAIIEIFEVPE